MTPKELKDKVKEYTANLVEAVKTGSDEAREYLAFAARIHRYSFGNILMIWAARPQATMVAGFHQWRKMGRHVKKGEKGIPIFAPMRVKKKAIEDEDETPEETRIYFRVVYVWDVSQTKGDPLPEQPDIRAVVGNLGENIVEALETAIADKGIAIIYKSLREALGFSKGGVIEIEETLSLEERFSVLVHEFAHELLHKQKTLGKKVKEMEAESVAGVVCSHFGLKTAAPTYLGLHRVEEADIIASLERIVATATQVIQGINENMPLEFKKAA